MNDQHGMTGHKNAAKEVTKSSRLYIRCTAEEKALWVRVSKGKGKSIAQWVTDTLNNAALKIDL